MTTFGEIAAINLGDCISCLDFSPGGDYLAAGCTDEAIYLWKAGFEPFDETAILKKLGHMMGVVDLKFNKQATKIAVSSLDSMIRVWDIDTSDLAIEVECQPLENWKLSYPDRNVVTCGELGRVAMYDSVSSEKTLELKTSEFFASALTVSHDGSKIAVGNVNGGLFIFNRDREYKMGRYQLHHKQIRALTFTEDSAKLISACDDQTIKVFDIESEQPQAELTGHKLGVTSVDTHPTDNKLIISSSLDKTVRLWDIRSKHMCGSIPYHSSAVWAARFNSNGKFVASGGESGILAIHSIK